MSINPYESPQTAPEDWIPEFRKKGAVAVPTWVSFGAVAIAGTLGGVIFLGSLFGLHNIGGNSMAFKTGVTVGSAGSFLVLVAIDWNYQRRMPAILSAFIGMLLASPIAYAVAFGIGLFAYGLATKGHSGASVAFLIAYFSFFFTLSAAGEMAIRLSRPAPLAPENERQQTRKEHHRPFNKGPR